MSEKEYRCETCWVLLAKVEEEWVHIFPTDCDKIIPKEIEKRDDFRGVSFHIPGGR